MRSSDVRARRGGAYDLLAFRVQQIIGQARLRFADPPRPAAALDRLRGDVGPLGPSSAPVFVLGSGWRTGSTLVQRMINDSGEVLVWGEPYGESAVVPRLVESLSFLDPEHGRFEGKILPDDAEPPEASEWTANMTPPLHHLLAAQRAYLDRLFAEPAMRHGRKRWGIKEVIWGRTEIELLATLYPDARFVLLVRDPATQWISYRPVTRRPWCLRWPRRPVGSPVSFGRMWRDLAAGFAAVARESPQATLVRYEDLSDPAELARLSEFLELRRPLAADLPQVGSSATFRRYFTRSIPAWERAVIRRITADAARQVGYA